MAPAAVILLARGSAGKVGSVAQLPPGSCHTSDPADAPPALVFLFPCPTGHMSPPQTQPQSRFLLAQLETGHCQGWKAVEEILKGSSNQREKGQLRLCCRMSAHGKPGLVGPVACRGTS